MREFFSFLNWRLTNKIAKARLRVSFQKMGLLQESAPAEDGREKSRMQAIESASSEMSQEELLAAITNELNTPSEKPIQVETVSVDKQTFEEIKEVIADDETQPEAFDEPVPPLKNDSGNTIFGEVIPLDDAAHPANKDHGRMQNTHHGIMMAKSMFTQLIRTSPETRAALEAVIQERAETAYLEASSRNDRFKLEALARQQNDLNQFLSRMEGQPTTVLGKYLGDPDNPPINTGAGLIAYRNFYIEMAKNVFPMFEIAGEAADIEAQKALIPMRTELAIKKMDADAEVAQKYIEIAPDLIEQRRLRGKALGEGIQSILVPILSSPAVALIAAPMKAGEYMAKEIDDAEDKMVPISAVIGATGTTFILLSTGILAAPLIAIPVGLLGGGGIGVATWKGVKMGSEALKQWAVKVYNEQKIAAAERKKVKDAQKAAQAANKIGNNNQPSSLSSGSSRR